MYDNSTHSIEADGPAYFPEDGLTQSCGDFAECHGDGPCPIHSRPATIVTASEKPCQIVGTATATVEADGATYDEVVDAGLAALRETRARLYGYGIKRLRRDTAPATLTGTFTVYADRD